VQGKENVKQDYYDGLIQERGTAVAAPLLADECRKADAEIKILRANLIMALNYCECVDGRRGCLNGSAIKVAVWDRMHEVAANARLDRSETAGRKDCHEG